MSQELIVQAIKELRLLEFYYEGGTRVVEPHQLATNEANHLALSAYRVRGYSASHNEPPWREYLASRMTQIRVLDENFSGSRPGYKRTPNKKFRSAIAEL